MSTQLIVLREYPPTRPKLVTKALDRRGTSVG